MSTQLTKHLLFKAALVLTALVPLASYGGITGTAHDLSTQLWNTSGQICIVCHTPHNAQATQLIPLWNHAATATSFTLYTSNTLLAVPGQPAGISKACLSCHDGTIALDSFGNVTGTNFMTPGTHVIGAGAKLNDDHPVSFTYDAALATADGGLVSPPNANFVDATLKVPLFAGKMECASCHDVHSNANAPFLRKSNAASALCLTCHIK